MPLPPLGDPERALALAYVPTGRRPALHALWALDEALGAIVAQAHEPTLARIRMAWWRSALLALGGGGPSPVDPLLRRLDVLVVPEVAPDRLAPTPKPRAMSQLPIQSCELPPSTTSSAPVV